jgi:hypothetical protein
VYWWGEKYSVDYVERLRNGIRRNLKQPYHFIVITDRERSIPGVRCLLIPEVDLYLTRMKGCFARLRLFDQNFLQAHGIDGKVVSVDLDLIVVGELDPLFDREDDFSILQGINASNPCPYNGSIWMLKAGTRPDVWKDFSLAAYHHYKVPYYAFPDDQGWLYYKFPKAGYYGPENGVYAYRKPKWLDPLPKDARIVAFPGYRDPSMFVHLSWVKEHWR